ncbi:hypothetical protein GCM10009760_30060 [Kitasatospora kazusensis]|uniref:DUF6542 domain-containing protein n=1 Tax=Kitasatospora kazusensis TaxID=407974 RepID=A0ABP5L8U1_9ACTN
MSGQRAGTADRSPEPGRRGAPDGALPAPAQRRSDRPSWDRPVGGGGEPAGAGPAAGRAAGRRGDGRAQRRTEPPRKGRGTAALFAVGLPLLGAAVDEAVGSGIGTAFAVCAVLGSALAALVSGRPGWWWVATAPPVVVLGVTAGAELLVHGSKYQGKALATGAAGWAIHGFPVMAAAVAAALLVVLIRIARDGRGRRG